MNLEENLKKIEDIVSTMEDPNLTVSDSVKLYEDGVALAKECFEELDRIKGKITIIKKDLDAYKEESLD